MGRMTLRQVFTALNERMQHLETGIDRRFGDSETAMAKLTRHVHRRIDQVDGRMDDFIKTHGGSRVAQCTEDDPSGPDR